jgi:hypothetical protein
VGLAARRKPVTLMDNATPKLCNVLHSSQQVSWWSVHEFISAAIDQSGAGPWPLVGTPAWCQLSDGDPRKWAALFDAAQHWALRVETCQAARCEASRDISAAEDWSTVARDVKGRAELHAQRPWLKRVVE